MAYEHMQNKITENKSFLVGFTLPDHDWKEYSLGILKMAYLKGFELFGYFFADLGNGANIRAVMQRTMDYPAPNNGVMDLNVDDEFLGLHIVTEPKELRALIIQKIVIKKNGNTIEKNIPVILPAPDEEGWGLLGNYHQYLGKTLYIKTEKFSLNQIPLLKAEHYYQLFEIAAI
jgi:hypothetical protein